MTFHEANEKLGKFNQCRLESNTWLVRLDERRIAVRLYKMNVVVIHANGDYTLASGGERTKTTKARINKYSPVRIYQERFAWYVDGGVIKGVPFFDGMIVDSRGLFMNAA